MKSSLSILSLCWAAFASGALAAPASTEAASHASDLAAAQVDLRVEPLGDGTIWRMTVQNRGGEPVRIAADARLLTLEVHPPAPPPVPEGDAAPVASSAQSSARRAKSTRETKPKLVKCQLPAGMRPVELDDDRALILAPGKAYEETFEPALYCFGAEASAAFAKGGEVVASLGFAHAISPAAASSKKKLKPLKGPFAVEPARFPATIAPLTELVAPAITRPAVPPVIITDAAPGAMGPSSADEDDEGAARLDLTASPFVDAGSAHDIAMAVWIKNTGHRPLRALLRRDGLTFEITGPSGAAFCGEPRPYRASPPEGLSVIAPGQRMTLDVLLGEICPEGTFDRPGLYRVRALITAYSTITTRSSAPATGLWSGTAMTDARTPSLVRVRTGPAPFHAVPPAAK